MSQVTLRISVYEYENSVGITLEGRVAGPWVDELSRVWLETIPRIGSKSLIIDLRNVTYADAPGTKALRTIYSQSHARLISGSPWTEYLAQQISNENAKGSNEEVRHASHE
jgi:hypothetical protein